MIGSIRNVGASTRRAQATPAIAPIARAVRGALAVSATMLVLSAPVSAQVIGSCTLSTSDAQAVHRIGQQTDDNDFAPIEDPTLVSEGCDATAVDMLSATGIGVSFASDAGASARWDAHGGLDSMVDDLTVVNGDTAAVSAGAPMVGTFAIIEERVTATGTDDAISYGSVEATESFTLASNYDSISATATAEDGDALAVGMLAQGWDAATLYNYAGITASATSEGGDAQAYAAVADGAYNGGIGVLINGGDLLAEATAGAGGLAYATGAYAYANVASVFNDVSSTAIATAGEGGSAEARAARAYGSYSAVYSYGDLTSIATADGGTAVARGADSAGFYGSTVYNAGDIHVSATGADLSTAMGSYSVGMGFSAYTTNTGSILAEAQGEAARAYGSVNASLYIGDAITINQGDISAVAEGGQASYGEAEAYALGVYNMAVYYASQVDNSGSIEATALAQDDMTGSYGFLQAKAIGVMALAINSYSETGVSNSGSITANALTSQGYAAAWGVAARVGGKYAGAISIDNTGTIRSYAEADFGSASSTGVYAYNLLGSVGVTNYGDIEADARTVSGKPEWPADTYAYSTGVVALSPVGYGNATIDNHGNIRAHASADRGIVGATGVQGGGKYLTVTNAADASISAIAETSVYGGGYATGVVGAALYGMDITNDGQITAYAHTHGLADPPHSFISSAAAMGIYAAADFGSTISIANNGDIDAIAIADDAPNSVSGSAGAVGIRVYSRGDVAIANSGDITASAIADLGLTLAYAVDIKAGQYGSIVNDAGTTIAAQASVGSMAGDLNAGVANVQGLKNRGASYATVYNAGTVLAHATVTADSADYGQRSIANATGASIGFYSNSGTSEIVNVGDVEAVASADFGYATAQGTYVRALWSAYTDNTGEIRASATAIGGDAWAVGSFAYALHQTTTYNCEYREGPYGQYNYCDWAHPNRVTDGGSTTLYNGGDIRVASSADGGVAHSYGAVVLGALEAGITNASHITVVAEADDAVAVAALANSFYGNASLVNSGDLLAVATGPVANATGANLLADTGVQADNSGTIVAAAYGADATATAVSMQSYGSNVLTNTGTIAALGDGTRIAISSNADATAAIVNQGSITGAIVTGNLDDSFENAAGGTWIAVGESDFGAGNNQFANAGTIVMDDATINLDGGAAATLLAVQPVAAGGSTFGNNATMLVSGADNAIVAGAFVNDGIVSFVDGSPDDVLTITGDFSGDGAINLDVSGLNQASDQLYVDGNIIESTTQTLNVNLVDAPTTPSIEVPLIGTSGTLAGDFVLGDVHFALDGFVAMDFDLKVADDAVSLGVDVTGLNATGQLAADIAPGVQSLVNAQVGTYRQRMGVLPEAGSAGLGPWMRMFTDSGNVDARYSGNFGAGGLGFHQSNHGWEVGLDTRPSEHLAFGAFIGKSDGSQRVNGAGSNRLDGSTFGLYGTWFGGHGAYVDVSHRWTGVDARLGSGLGTQTTKASAQSLNVEGGFTAWTSAGGFNVVPQLQYTHTRIGDIRTLHSSDSEFANDGGVSSRCRLGVAFDQSFQSGGFTLTPYGSFNVVREFDGDFDHAINGGIEGTTTTSGSSRMVELGMGVRKGGLSVSGGANWTDGGAVDSVAGAQLTVRYNW